MNCRTESLLSDKLEQDIAWRIQEVSIIKNMVKTTKSKQLQAVIRSGLTILYAHWEGFVKVSSEAYLQYVYYQKHKYCELADCFVALGLKSKLNVISSSNKTNINIQSVSFVRDELNNKASFSLDKAINTKSNLNSETFENIAVSIGLDYSKYTSKYPLIDIQLLKNRNEIAHGNYLKIDQSAFLTLADEVITLIRDYKTDIENAAYGKYYLKQA